MIELLQRFVNKAPVAVMAHATLTRIVGDAALDDIFERHADSQYTRDLAFSTLARLMTQVVFQEYPSIHAAYRQDDAIPVSVASIYNKLNGLEIGVSQALVAETARSMSEIVLALPDPPAERVAGLRLRAIDGNYLAGTDHRLACLRDCGAAALPGMSLVVRDALTGLMTHLIPHEDAHANERALLQDALPLVNPDDLWLGDRNFCTDAYMGGIEARRAFFLIRHHRGSKLNASDPETPARDHPDGTISEQAVRVGSVKCRCVTIRLKKSLRNDETELRLLTNVPAERLSAEAISDLYRTRWQIETAFQELTESVRCEINTLGYPKAALFGFALAIVAYNILVVIRAALVSGLGEEIGGAESLSSYHMATEMAAVEEGLSIAIAKSEWRTFLEMKVPEFANWLHETARQLNWKRYHKKPRGPKKPVTVKRTKRGSHRSTARELNKNQE